MGKDMSGKTGGNALEAAAFQGTCYDKPGMTVEAHAILNSARENYSANFDLIDELLGARVGSGARDLRIRYDTFLKPRAENGILLGYAIPKLVQNLDEFKAGKRPTPPQEGEPGSELAKGGIYEIWFAHTGDWYKGRAENLDKRAGGKFDHVADLEKLPSDSDVEKLPDEAFGKLYGFTKEGFLQKDGVTFDKKYGGDKTWFLRNHVLKRLTWEEVMMLKEVENSIYTHSVQYGPSADAPTASWIVSHVYGLSCGEKVDFSVLASDQEAQKGIALDPDGAERERYWKLVDEKLKDARFMTEENFSKKWETSKDAFVDEIVPKLHKIYDRVIAGKVTSMSAEELKDRYYLSELRGDELIGELLGGTHSVRERVAELESQRDKLTRYIAGFSKKREDFEKNVDARDESRDERLVELKKAMSKIEHAHPELAFVEDGIFEPYAGEQAKREKVMKDASEGKKVLGYNLKSGKDNFYLTYLGQRDALKDEKKKVDELAAELVNLKDALEKTDVSSLGFGVVKDLLDTLNATKTANEDAVAKTYSSSQTSVKRIRSGKIEQGGGEILQDGEFDIKILKGYLEEELNLGELEKLEARRNEIGGDLAKNVSESGSKEDVEESNQKWADYEKKIGEREKTVLPEIEAAKEKWKAQALRVIDAELEKQNARSACLTPDIERFEGEISYFEKKLGIEDYKRLKARQKELEVEFPISDKSKSVKVMVIRKLAFDALAKAEETLGKEEYRKLEARRNELKENPDPALKEAALKEMGILEERLGIAPYKKLEARSKEIESEIQRRLGTGVYKWIRARKEELEQLIDVTERDTNKEYQGYKAHGEKLEENIRKTAFGEIENLEKALGITGYTDIETAEKRLNDRIDELKKTQSIPGEIETKRNEIERKEDFLKCLVGEIEGIENKFGVHGYAEAALEGRIGYLKENLPRDPAFRRLALKGILSSSGKDPNSKGVTLRGVEFIERDLESVKYDKNRLTSEIMELEGKLPKAPKLELQELENLERAKGQVRLAKERWMATHGVEAFGKWNEEHGVTSYKRLVDEEKAIEKTRTNDYWALKEAHDTTVKTNVTLNDVDLELGYLKNRLADDRQLPELRDMLWGRGKYSDAPVSMAVFNGLYSEIEAQLPDESKKLLDIARKNLKARTEWMGSHPSVRDQRKLAAERAAFEFDVLSPKRLFGWKALAESGDTSELGKFAEMGFGIKLPANAKIEKADGGKTVNVHDGDKQIMSASLYNHDELAMVETADGRIEMNLLARTDPKTGELVIFPHMRPDTIMNMMYEQAHTKKKTGKS